MDSIRKSSLWTLIFKMKIGWCCTALEAKICFPEPKRVTLGKDLSTGGRGFLSCPAVRDYFSNTFVVTSPFSLRLRCDEVAGSKIIRPVYPFTSLSQPRVNEWVKVEPKSSWRSGDAVIIQIPSPYLFIADDPIFIRQDPVLLSTPSSFSWRLIPGRFNIYDWQRPLNWAFEWFPSAGDFIIKAGEPIYNISFDSPDGLDGQRLDLQRIELSPKLEERLQELRGVVSIKRGVSSLFEDARASRAAEKFIP